MNQVFLKDLKPSSFFTSPLFLDGKFILLSPETPLSASMIRNLLEWDFRELHTEGKAVEEQSPDSSPDFSAEEAQAQTSGNLPSTLVDKEKIQQVLDFYKKFTSYVEDVFSNYVTKNELNVQIVSNRIKELCDFIRDNRRFILRIQDTGTMNRNYLVSHAVKSTILSLVLGSYLKLPSHRLIELGVASLLHEIGMVRLPPQLYMNDRPLNPQEKKTILTHPILGYNILRTFSFPLNICLAALEHHERENGAGYPRKLSGEKISLYAKIIMVACSYEAVTTARPYKEAKDSYSGMLDILKNTGKQYDETVIKALVYSLSIYPIGLHVLLSNGKRAQVIDVSPDNPRFPIVGIRGGNPDGTDMAIATSENGIKIARPLTKEEQD
jgi:HD-GYP domain-containing protein (c-di-GMP phosphodiesterase class II)